MQTAEPGSTRPYLIRALYEWCTDNGLTPFVAVQADATTQVPREYVKDGEIVLNISFEATSGLKLGNEYIEFKARFAGVAREIVIPVERVLAIYARENGQGMAFPTSSAGNLGRASAADGGKEPAFPVPAALEVDAGEPVGRGRLTPVRESSSGLDPGTNPETPPEKPRPGGAGARVSLKRVK